MSIKKSLPIYSLVIEFAKKSLVNKHQKSLPRNSLVNEFAKKSLVNEHQKKFANKFTCE